MNMDFDQKSINFVEHILDERGLVLEKNKYF